ncbi:zinc finger HIT domain-containing protein 2-like [Portunus trituberculatus]|uniref:zinc finger HIT domain-containing protein 2-like n=1 Tax=Portunus trituberculatus TaxID=210409 RepID=UPI001E1D18C7|nr:zinc finger HIT domain-containing protein 2-like [Portunus trituberculatus]
MASAPVTTAKCTYCTNPSKYTCPRCNTHYCSSSCYRNADHVQCSENFYREQVEEEMQGCTVSDESKRKMMEILQRVKSGESVMEAEDGPLDSDDDENEEDLSVRMAGVDLNDSEAVWRNMTEEERQDFQELVKKGNFEELIPAWNAWWDQEVQLVQEVISGSPTSPSYTANCPGIVEVPPLSEITKVTPSPCLPYNILNVLAAYVWTVRLFNGDHQDSSQDATEAILTLSSVLASGASYEEAALAVESPKMEAQNHLWLQESEEFANTVRRDVWKILQGPTPSNKTYYIRAALSEIHVLLNTCKTALAKKKRPSGQRKGMFTSSFPEENTQVELKIATLPMVKSVIKKVEFLLSYAVEYSELLAAMSPP